MYRRISEYTKFLSSLQPTANNTLIFLLLICQSLDLLIIITNAILTERIS